MRFQFITRLFLVQLALYKRISGLEIIIAVVNELQEEIMESLADAADQLNLDSLKAIVNVPGTTLEQIAADLTSDDSPIPPDQQEADLQTLASKVVQAATSGFANLDAQALQQATLNLIDSDGQDGLMFIAHAMQQDWFSCGNDLNAAHDAGAIDDDDFNTLNTAVFDNSPPDLLPVSKTKRSLAARQEMLKRALLGGLKDFAQVE
jgi:hypothetical protein